MSRPPNAVDFWRGFALVEIFVDHIPGNFWGLFTQRNFGHSDAAELFVFLAGWSLRFMVGARDDPRPAHHLLVRLYLRAGKLYAAQMVIVMIAIAMLATASRVFDNPLYLEWYNAAAVFNAPVETHVGLVVLTHQLGYFDILPLYVLLLFLAPLIAILHRRAPALLLPISGAVWLFALVTQTTFSTWPTEGEWYFDPLCWQFIYVLGFTMGRKDGPATAVRRRLPVIRWIALPLVLASAVAWRMGWSIDPTSAPSPHLLFVDDKAFLTPTRLLHFLLAAALFGPFFAPIDRWAPRLSEGLALIGRNSLLVFCIGSVLDLACQILQFAFHGGFVWDTTMVVAGLSTMYAAARVAEWWERVR